MTITSANLRAAREESVAWFRNRIRELKPRTPAAIEAAIDEARRFFRSKIVELGANYSQLEAFDRGVEAANESGDFEATLSRTMADKCDCEGCTARRAADAETAAGPGGGPGPVRGPSPVLMALKAILGATPFGGGFTPKPEDDFRAITTHAEVSEHDAALLLECIHTTQNGMPAGYGIAPKSKGSLSVAAIESTVTTIHFQEGPIDGGRGLNGVSEAVLLAIVRDRLERNPNVGPGRYVGAALSHVRLAMEHLQRNGSYAAEMQKPAEGVAAV
jgi:hypothetical protein